MSVNPEFATTQTDTALGAERTRFAGAMGALLSQRVATEKRIFDAQNQPDTRKRLLFQLENPEAIIYEFWEEQMIKFLVYCTSPGRYCHEGEDLLTDFLRSWQIDPEQYNSDNLQFIADRIVDEYDTNNCSSCNSEGGVDD